MTTDVLDRVRHRFTVAEYHKMAERGVFLEGERIELVQGELIDMAPIGSWHASVVTRLLNEMAFCAGKSLIVSSQNPLFLDPFSEPQPDLMLLKPRADFYGVSHPSACDVLLLVEVADSTLEFDRDVKVPLYARHGIPEVWLVAREPRALSVYRDPCPESAQYRAVTTHGEGTVAPEALPQCAIEVAALW